MAEELVDFRARITRETDAVLEAYWRAHQGFESKSEVARMVLAEWAEQQVHAVRVMHESMKREGLVGE